MSRARGICTVVVALIAILPAVADGAIRFRTPTQMALEYLPTAVATGDLNGDGISDIVLSSYIETTLTVLLGNGQSGFTPAPPVPVARAGIRIYIRDLNEDEAADLIISHDESNNVTVIPGRGDGTFDDGKVIVPGHDPVGVAIADLDGDGILDLSVALSDEVGGMLAVMRGRGDFQFELVQTLSVATDAFEVVVAHFDADGFLDAATSNPGTGNVSLLRGVAGGLFEVGDEIPVGPGATLLELADVDRDGSTDLVVGRIDQMVSVLRGNGDGTFAEAENYPSGGRALNRIIVADVDGDGVGDIATSHLRSLSAGVLFGRSDGTFDNARVFAAAVSPVNLGVADINSDSLLDLISANEGVDSLAPSLAFLLATPERSFLAAEQLFDAPLPDGAAVADFNADGIADAVVGARQTRQVAIFPGGRDMMAPLPIFLPLDRLPEDVVAADFDRDGRSDIAVLTSIELAFFFGNDGGFEPGMIVPLPSDLGRDLATGDFDGDGDVDLAISRPRAPFAIDIVRHDSGRTFTVQMPFLLSAAVSTMAVGDLNGDHRDDIAVNSADNRILLFVGTDDGLSDGGTIFAGGVVAALAIGDVDGNGAADVVAAIPLTRRLATFRNDGTGTFTPAPATDIGFVSALALRDLDSDGLPESIVTDILTGETTVLRNQGGTWRSLAPLTTGERPAALAAGDFNDDGRYDLIASGLSVCRQFNESDGNIPLRGDANGDGAISAADFSALTLELFDGDGIQVEGVARGEFAGAFGADADGDGVVTTTETPALFVRWVANR